MKRIKFYVCPVCGNVISSTGMAEISCCGRKLNALKARPADLSHSVSAKAVGGRLLHHPGTCYGKAALYHLHGICRL